MRTSLFLLLGCLVAAAVPMAADPFPKPGLTKAWVREVLPGQDVSAAYLQIENRAAAPDALLAVSCSCAKTVELHRMVHTGDRMTMERVERIALPAGERVELAPGGLHLMLFGLVRPLRAGERVKLVLRFEQAGTVEVEAPVQALAGKAHGQ
jgi:copper(I)-binding protein